MGSSKETMGSLEFCSCGSTVVLCSVWLCGWISGSYNTWLLVFCVFHTVAFFQKDLFFLGCTLLLVVCHNWYRWLEKGVDLQMRKIYELLYCLLISRRNLLLPLLIFSGSRWYFRVDYSTFVLFGKWYGARASWIYFPDVLFKAVIEAIFFRLLAF